MMYSFPRKIGRVVLSACLAFSLVPVSAFAAGDRGAENDTPLVAWDGNGADYASAEGNEAVSVRGPAAQSISLAQQALVEETGLSAQEAGAVSEELFTSTGVQDDDQTSSVPRQADGTNIESISAKWITPDSTDNGDSALLYVRPDGDTSQSVRLQINYALSGEHNYGIGDVTITVPTSMFKDRTGNGYGNLVIPYPEDPSTRNDFNWKLMGDNYILTNTKPMSAATKGYIQFAFADLYPHALVDMAVSDPFGATIEVITHKGNLIALDSNELTAQFDTQAVVTRAAKRTYGSVERVKASSIPEAQRIDGEEEYILVRWYTWANTASNTSYTLSIDDAIPQDAVVITTSDGRSITEADAKGFIVGAVEDGTEVKRDAYTGWRDGETSYYYYSTAYPASQFEPDTDYTFHNAVTYTVTETDPEAAVTNPNVGPDPKKVTTATASAQTTWNYTDPVWIDPTGHYMVTKNGNDDTARNNYTHRSGYADNYSDLHIWSRQSNINGWYGIYPSALNELQDGNDVRLSYTVDTVGYIMPWTYKEVVPGTLLDPDGNPVYDNEGKQVYYIPPTRIQANYFQRPVTITTEDTGLRIGRYGADLVPGVDYEYQSIEFPGVPWIYTGRPHNINPDGSWNAVSAGDGTFLYARDSDRTHYPDIVLELQRNGAWEPCATASWKTGSLVVTLADGGTQTSGVVKVPADTENFRTVVTSTNAAIDYDVRVAVKLLRTKDLAERVDELFSKSNTPQVAAYNGINMKAVRADTGEDIVSIDRDGYDSLRGYTTDTAVYPYKSSRQYISDVDYENRTVTIHYSARVEERSVINDRATYEQAIADGRLTAETHGFWRDLLPKGVTPDLGSIKLRDGDAVVSAYVIPDYQGSGRTMLVVEANLKPTPERYRSGDMFYYQDAPAISFDAIYDFESLTDFGDNIHNVIAFESSNDFIGTVEHYTGEPDNPYSQNNAATRNAFSGNDERDRMTDLDEERDTPSFVYAGVYTKIDILSAARTSLSKDVQVNNDGRWGDGLYYGNPDQNKLTVYTGGVYSYRLRMMSDDSTVSKDLVIYDSLENFHAGDGNDAIDVDAPRWQGSLLGVDTSQLESLGCAPVVYYSTVENLQLSDEDNSNKGNAVNMDLSNGEIWTKAADYTGNLENVKAIAIDASHKADGSDFELQPLESATVFVQMRAPEGEEAEGDIAQKGVWGESAHAYNNAYLMCTSIDQETGEADSDNFVHKDYTKVGLEDYELTVTKRWTDDNDRDGIRPQKVTVHLLRNGEDTGESLELTEDGGWTGSFTGVAYCDPEGNPYRYSASEDAVEGYTFSFGTDGAASFTLTNTHEPERTRVEGEKTWVGDNPQNRPASIQVRLFANGSLYGQQTIRPDAKGTWSYAFENLFKYSNHGEEIVYTVEESASDPAADSYVSEIDGLNIVNTYHPYGDLMVSKKIKDTTAVSADTDFAFTFVFTRDVDGEEQPVFETYEYEVLDANDAVVSTGELSTNSTVTIKGGQRIHVKEIDEKVHYAVTEQEMSGFAQRATDATGSIAPNATADAQFVNTYSAKGRINLEAKKTLKNRELTKYQFRFELYRVDTDEAGNETETLIRTTTNDRPDQTATRPDGTVESSTAPVVFGAITYTQDDANAQAESGKPYTYRIKEVDLGKPGYTYDDSVYTVTVAVTDNGDGTLTVVPTYYGAPESGSSDGGSEPGDGTSGDDGAQAEPVEVETAAFTNEYKAEGQITLRAWKELRGRDLAPGEFTFELVDERGQVVGTATNAEDGSIVFAPPSVSGLMYNQNDIGKTYHCSVHEVYKYSPTVAYDTARYGYVVEVLDNGDGTLSFSQGNATPILDYASPCSRDHEGTGRFSYQLMASSIMYDETLQNAWNKMASAFEEAGATVPMMGGRAFCDGNNAEALTAFNELLAALGIEERASSADTMFIQSEYNPTMYAPIITLGYFCTTCGGTDGKCQTCGGTGKLTPKVVDGSTYSYYAPAGPMIYSSGIDTYYQLAEAYPSSVAIQAYARICRIGGEVTIANEHNRQWYIDRYMHWRNNYDTLGLPHTVDTRVPHAEFTGVDAELARLFGVPEDSYATYAVDMVYSAGIGHGSGVAVYVIEATCSQEYDCPECSGTGKEKVVVGWNTEEPEMPVFENTLVPGALSVSKYVTNPEEADPHQEFTFRVKLIGEDLPEGEREYAIVQAPEAQAPSSASGASMQGQSDDEAEASADAADAGTTAMAPQAGGEEVIVAQGTAGAWGISWRVNSDGELVLGNGGTQNFNTVGHPYSPADAPGAVYSPWCSYTMSNGVRNSIKSIRIDGTVHASGSFQMIFNGQDLPNLQSVDFTGMDFNGVTNLNYMLAVCGKLKTVKFGDSATANRATMQYMLYGCSSLEELDMSELDMSKVSSMSGMLLNVSTLKKVSLAPGNTLKNKVNLNTPPTNSQYTGKWVHEDGTVLTASGWNTYPTDMGGTWVWQERPVEYTVRFTAEEGAAGSMAPVVFNTKVDNVLSADLFVKYGYRFDHWVEAKINGAAVEDGRTYADKDTVPAGRYKEGDVVTLQAVFVPRDKTINIQNGEFTFTLLGGEKAIFEDFPAGTAYQVWEETPDGWVLVDQQNVSGTIAPAAEQAASFWNRYQPGVATAQLSGAKTLDGKVASAGAFTFELIEDGKVLQTVSTLDGGFIQFDPIVYEEAGTHEYTIREVDPADDAIDYDVHEETATVEVVENDDGTLSATVAYDPDGAAFANKTRPGGLSITKVGEGATDENKDDVFTFKIKLTSPNGMPIDDSLYWYVDGAVADEGADAGGSNAGGPTTQSILPALVDGTAAGSAASSPAGGLALGTASEDPDYASGTSGTCTWKIDAEGLLTIEPADGVSGTLASFSSSSNVPWLSYSGAVRKVVVKPGVKTSTGCVGMFSYLSRCSEMDLSGLDTSDARDMSYMFRSSSALTSIDLSRFDTSKVSDMSYMFSECTGLTSLDLGSFNTAGVYDMDYMFNGCYYLASLDLSGFETARVTNMAYMFYNCTRLTTLDLSSFDTSRVTNMSYMLSNCRALESLDVSNFDTSKVTRMTFMMADSSNVKWIKLSPKMTRFVSDPYIARPSGTGYTGNWVKEDGTVGPKTRSELYSQYPSNAADWAGVWVWEVDPAAVTVNYDANGGVTTAKQTLVMSPYDVTLPDESTTTREGRFLMGWSDDPSATEPVYEAGAQVEGIGEAGDTLTLYAVWTPENVTRYKVVHKQQRITLDGYDTVEEKNYFIEKGSEVTPAVNEYEDYESPDAQTVAVADDGTTEVVYYYDHPHYTIVFDGNGETSGKMRDQKVLPDNTVALTANSYRKTGSIFEGWNTEPDGSGTSYADGEEVQGLAAAGQTITLFAQWTNNDNDPVKPQDGVIYVSCKAGETIVIPELPAGTVYTIEEVDIPDGWTKTGSVGEDGSIVANAMGDASFTNRYSAEGQAVILAHKALADGELTEGQFSFELLDKDGRVLQTIANDAVDAQPTVADEDGNDSANPWVGTAPVQFAPLFYSTDDIGKTFTYTVREVAGDDSSVAYDTHEETVNVTVSDAGHGLLACTVAYDEDGALFENSMQATELKVSKEVANPALAPAGAEFSFTLDLSKADGSALGGRFPAVLHAADGAESEIEVESGGRFSLKGGEYIVVSGLPNGTSYTVTEAAVSKWEIVSSEGASGVTSVDKAAEASFVNAYLTTTNDVDGVFSIRATKHLDGRAISEDDDFAFELTDEEGAVLQVVGCDEVGSADSAVTFDALGLSKEDVGKVLTYYVREIPGTDEDMTCDSTVYTVRVTPTADANGKISADVIYLREGGDEEDGEATEVESLAFTNTVEYTAVPVEKVWADGDNADGLRPSSIAVSLLANGEKMREAELSEENGWKTRFEGLPRFSGGREIAYTVEEEEVAGYEVAVSGTAAGGFTITNSHEPPPPPPGPEPETTEIPVAKVWDDADDADGIRPASVTVRLLSDGADAGKSVVLSAENGWKASFEGLPVAGDDGAEIAYTVSEDEVAGYEVAVSGTAAEGFTVTNTHEPPPPPPGPEPEMTGVAVKKVWDDHGNEAGLRPESVTVHLLADGEDTGKSAVLSAETEWVASFDELPVANDAGETIAYSIEEDAVEGYTSTVSGTAKKGFTVTNSYKEEQSEKVDIPVKKVWSDSNDSAKKRPSSVTVHLLAGGTDTGRKAILSAENEWKAVFEGLSKKDESGATIAYTVTEDAVTGYTAKVAGSVSEGFTVTNTYKPPTTTTTKKTPQTGDPLATWPLAVLALASMLCMAFAGIRLRRRD